VKRLWFLLLAASVGLNAAMLWQHFTAARAPEPAPFRERMPRGGPMAGPPGVDAPGPEGMPGPRGEAPPSYADMQERRLDHMARRLELDPDQVERLRAIALDHAAEMDSLRTSARAARGRIRDLLAADVVDAAAVREQAQRLRAIDTRIEQRITENLILEAQVLDPGQRERYLSLMRFGNNRGRRGVEGPRRP